MADLVARENSLDDLIRARRSALKRMSTMMETLKQQGYYR